MIIDSKMAKEVISKAIEEIQELSTTKVEQIMAIPEQGKHLKVFKQLVIIIAIAWMVKLN